MPRSTSRASARDRFRPGRRCLAVAVAIAAVVFAALGASSLLQWRADQRAAQVRIDVLGRERALVMSVLGEAEHLTVTSSPQQSDELATSIELLLLSWDAVVDGGPELSLDLEPTGRTVEAWPVAMERTEVAERLPRFAIAAEWFLELSTFARIDALADLDADARVLFEQLNELVRYAGDESVDDDRFVWAAVEFVASAALVVALGLGLVAGQRRRAANDAVRSHADERTQRLFEHAHDVVMVLTGDGDPIWVSPAMARVLGHEQFQARADLIGILHPDDEARVRGELRSVLLGERASITCESRVRHADGRWLQMRIVATNHTDDPYLGGLLLTLTDITEERQAEIERETAAALHQFLADNSSDLMIRATSEGEIIYASSAAGPLLGVYPDDIIGAPVRHLVEEEDAAQFEAALEEARHSGGVAMVDVRASLSTAWRSVWLGVSCQYVIGLDNDREFHLSMRDISERVRSERRLAEERQLLETTLSSIQAGVLAIDADSNVVKVNDGYETMVGFRPRLGESLLDFFHRYQMLAADGTPVALEDRPLTRALGGETVIDNAATLIDARGERREILANAVPMFDGETVKGAVLTIHDVTMLRAAEEELRQLATVDPLTELPNRRRLMQHLDGAIARAQRHPSRLNVLFLDLDGFKAVNDELGHDAGDELLVAVARRLEAAMRTGDLVARLGGDEFVIVVENLEDLELVRMLVDRVERVLSVPIELSVGVVSLGGSVGVVTNDGSSTADQLLSRADAAMYERKRVRKARAA